MHDSIRYKHNRDKISWDPDCDSDIPFVFNKHIGNSLRCSTNAIKNLFNVDIPLEGMDQMNRVLEFEIINREDAGKPENAIRHLKDVAPNTHAMGSNHSLDVARGFASTFLSPKVQFCHHLEDLKEFNPMVLPTGRKSLPFLPMFVMELYTEPPEKRKPFAKYIKKHDKLCEEQDNYPGQLHCIAIDLRPNRHVILNDMLPGPVAYTLENFQSAIHCKVEGKAMYGIHTLYQVKLAPVKPTSLSACSSHHSSGFANESRMAINDSYLRRLETVVKKHKDEDCVKINWETDAKQSFFFHASSKTALLCSLNSIQNLFGVSIPNFMMNIAARMTEIKILARYVKTRKYTNADDFFFADWCLNLWQKKSWPLDVALEVVGSFFSPRIQLKSVGIDEIGIDGVTPSLHNGLCPMFIMECYAVPKEKRLKYHDEATRSSLHEDEVIGPLHCISVDLRENRKEILDCKEKTPIPFDGDKLMNHVTRKWFGFHRAYQVKLVV